MKKKSTEDRDEQGMDFLLSLPRRWVTVYIPLMILMVILLFPFYWMIVTSFKTDAQLNSSTANPFMVVGATLENYKELIFNTAFPQWMLNTLLVAFMATFISLFTSAFAAYAI